MNKFLVFTILFPTTVYASSYHEYWQQRVEYTMDVELNVNTHILIGRQELTYYNNSPDTLYKVYFHLQYNAFQPGSMMDVRARTQADPDRKIGDKILHLEEDELGYQQIQSLHQNGSALAYEIIGTIMKVTLAEPVMPNTNTNFKMTFKAQVPLAVRRTGRDNPEGIAYSMAQWYPKIAEYDQLGWHPYQYVGKEFYSVWGDFDVKITLDSRFMVAGTGILQKPEKIGFGYTTRKVKHHPKKLTWHFTAKNVIDFAWAADSDYTHDIIEVPDGPAVHLFYQRNEHTEENWSKLSKEVVEIFNYMNNNYGEYPYKNYSIIQAGDAQKSAMEYPMCTFITGESSWSSLLDLTIHEIAHSWYQAVLATNEALYAWMDEGFASYVGNELFNNILLSKRRRNSRSHAINYDTYFKTVEEGKEELANQHADHFDTNKGYMTAAYAKGAIFLNQLKYVVGYDNFEKGMMEYYNTWKFRHPTPNDFIRIMEKVSGMELHWYLRDWINTTKTIDYSIESVSKNDEHSTEITLRKKGLMPMPIDLEITYVDGVSEIYYIPLIQMYGAKPKEHPDKNSVMMNDWPWVNPTYLITVDRKKGDIKSVQIDPSARLADIYKADNSYIIADQP